MDRTYNILFLCTGNSARSIMAECLATHLGRGRIAGFSAGSRPVGKVNPFAVAQLAASGVAATDLRSKSWDEFARADAPRMDFIVTVCDNAAGEICPHWPGHPATAHWSFEDPAAVDGTDEDKRAAFAHIYGQIERRIRKFAGLSLETMEPDAVRAALREIGEAAA
ncbi:arsenate reductase ArsC [Massilia endophytica]|uniref:arsenate reductase ArsC n=1 Tax=Massilia endophytica TaxID=2899220 RepID=UPI001E60A810|nr:arsenate reductase ArsC [Massilia endophytica]UGQ46952.1 arsenate reductase ArsC [Massilia endophytica]